MYYTVQKNSAAIRRVSLELSRSIKKEYLNFDLNVDILASDFEEFQITASA
jgi:hypothetical protein